MRIRLTTHLFHTSSDYSSVHLLFGNSHRPELHAVVLFAWFFCRVQIDDPGTQGLIHDASESGVPEFCCQFFS